MRASSVMVAVVAAAACGQAPVLVCHDSSIPAVTVVVRDSATNAPIAQDSELVGILRDGSHTEAMWRSGSELRGGDDRPGHYGVEIRAEGYQAWTRSGVIVEPGVVCLIDDPTELTARLVPTSEEPMGSAGNRSVVPWVPQPSLHISVLPQTTRNTVH